MGKIPAIKYFFLAAVCFSSLRCASQIEPSGGPVDREGPTVLETYPLMNATGFKDEKIEITFSEYVDQTTAEAAFFISPRPKGDLSFSWSGRKMLVTFNEPLKENTTYSVSVGTALVDLNGRNPMAHSFRLLFSTSSAIDKSKISGRVIAPNPQGISVFLYKKDGREINPQKTPPDFQAETESDGSYTLPGLPEGNFRAFAFRSSYRDTVYKAYEDEYGVLPEDISLTDSINNVDFLMAKEDSSKAFIKTAAMTDQNHVLLEYNKDLDSSLINAGMFFIRDSLKGKTLSPKFLFKDRSRPRSYYLAFSPAIENAESLILYAEAPIDASGRKGLKGAETLTFNSKKDSIPPMASLPEEMLLDEENPGIEVNFNDGVSLDSLKNAIKISDKNKKDIPFGVEKIDDASFRIRPGEVSSGENYSLSLRLNLLPDAAFNRRDSILTGKFQMMNAFDYASLSGVLKGFSDSSSLLVSLKSVEGKRPSYRTKAAKGGKYQFTKVKPGRYIVSAHSSKGKGYDYGRPYPYRPSGEFVIYPDTLNLKSRWPVEDLNLIRNGLRPGK